MKIGILESTEDPRSVSPTTFRTKSFCTRLVNAGIGSWTGKAVIQLSEGVHRSGLGQFLVTFGQEYGQEEVWQPHFEIKFDPALRESPGLRYPLLLARRQQSFQYSDAAYA